MNKASFLLASGGGENVIVFDTPGEGTWTVPEGWKQALVIVTGGGGSGSSVHVYEGSGGGAGGTSIGTLLVSYGDVVPFVIGKGGEAVVQKPTSASGYSGNDGHGSRIQGMECEGGKGGQFHPSASGNWMSPTAPGGSASGGLINIKGGHGLEGIDQGQPSGVWMGGGGGSSFWGGAGNPSQSAVNGDFHLPSHEGFLDALGPGSGGGARTTSSLLSRSGKGADGIIVIIKLQ